MYTKVSRRRYDFENIVTSVTYNEDKIISRFVNFLSFKLVDYSGEKKNTNPCAYFSAAFP